MAWCNGPGARAPPSLRSAVSQSADFGDFDLGFGVGKKVRILTMPLCWGGPEGLPGHFSQILYFSKSHSRGPSSRILCFPAKKVGQKSPFCPRPPMSTGARIRPAGMYLFPTTFLDCRLLPTKKYRFGGQKTTKHLDVRTPAPMFTETGPGGGVRACGVAHRPVWWPHRPCVVAT